MSKKNINEKTPLLPSTTQPPGRPPLVSAAPQGAVREFPQNGAAGAASQVMVEYTSISLQSQPRKSDILRVDKEAVIQVSKEHLVSTLAASLNDEEAKGDFALLGQRMASVMRAWYRQLFDELLHMYELFDPEGGEIQLKFEPVGVEQVEQMEQAEIRFLEMLLEVMCKSNFSLLRDRELEVALQCSYLLSLPVRVDAAKLDTGLLSRFLKKSPLEDAPKFAEQYLIFKRGVGIDQTTGLFIYEKMNLVLGAVWRIVLAVFCMRRTNQEAVVRDIRRPNKHDDEGLAIERIRLENMPLSLKNIFSRNIIQEPTFERVVLIYRLSAPSDPSLPLGPRSICVKQFAHVPMADAEIVLPEKMVPGLTPVDWLYFFLTVFGGLTAVFTTLQLQFSMTVVVSVSVALISYILKVYFAWNQTMQTYYALLQQSVYAKQLDSGRGSLLHICDDVEQQEVGSE